MLGDSGIPNPEPGLEYRSKEYCAAMAKIRWGGPDEIVQLPDQDEENRFDRLSNAWDKGCLRFGDLADRSASGASSSNNREWCHANAYNIVGVIRQASREVGKGYLNQAGKQGIDNGRRRLESMVSTAAMSWRLFKQGAQSFMRNLVRTPPAALVVRNSSLIVGRSRESESVITES